MGGKIAAQLRLVDGQGRLCTLYQFRPGEDYQGLEESSFQIDGVQVTVWREAGLVMGLAR